MASRRQIAANRRNAKKSTGPRTIAGKLRSRRNALKHGLTGETIVTVFEDPAPYDALQKLVVAQYRPTSAVEEQLVVRLTSLLWRLRRATAIETGLFEIQGRIIAERRTQRLRGEDDDRKVKTNLYSMMGFLPKRASVSEESDSDPSQPFHLRANAGQKNKVTETDAEVVSVFPPYNSRAAHLRNERPETVAQCFMRVARLDDQVLDRVSRYEAALWKQARQIVYILAKSRPKRFRSRAFEKNC